MAPKPFTRLQTVSVIGLIAVSRGEVARSLLTRARLRQSEDRLMSDGTSGICTRMRLKSKALRASMPRSCQCSSGLQGTSLLPLFVIRSLCFDLQRLGLELPAYAA